MAKKKSWWEKTREEAEGKVNATINDVKGKVGASVEDIKGGFGGGYGGGGGVDVSGAFKAPEGGFGLPSGISTGGLPNVGGGGLSGAGFGPDIMQQLGSGGALGPWDILGTKLDSAFGLNKKKVNYTPVDVAGIYGNYQGVTNALGDLSDKYKLGDVEALNSQMGDAVGLKELQTRATEKGPSTWAKMAMENQQLDEQNMLNQANQAQAGQMAGARSGLAMRGGLRGGAAERLAASGQENALLGGQGIRNQGMQGRIGIGMQDENNKLNLLSQLPGAELARAGYLSGLDQQNLTNKLGVNQFNLGTKITDLGAQNQWKKDLASGTIAATGAAQTASATENAGKK